MDLKEIGINTRDWVDSFQDRDYWRALVNAELNLGFHKPWSQLIGLMISLRINQEILGWILGSAVGFFSSPRIIHGMQGQVAHVP